MDGPPETERLILRPIVIEDVDLLLDLDSDPEVMRYINGGRPSRREEVESIVGRSIGHRWIASERSTGEFFGWVAARPTGLDEYELGYRLRRSAWGRGLATEGATDLTAWAFSEWDARRVWAQTMTVNTRSRAVMERVGLRFVRTFKLDWPEEIDGSEHGDVEYELLRADWEQQ